MNAKPYCTTFPRIQLRAHQMNALVQRNSHCYCTRIASASGFLSRIFVLFTNGRKEVDVLQSAERREPTAVCSKHCSEQIGHLCCSILRRVLSRINGNLFPLSVCIHCSDGFFSVTIPVFLSFHMIFGLETYPGNGLVLRFPLPFPFIEQSF